MIKKNASNSLHEVKCISLFQIYKPRSRELSPVLYSPSGCPSRRHNRSPQCQDFMDVRGSASLPATGILTKEANYASAKHGLESEKNQCCLFPRNRFCSSASMWGGWRTSGCSSREKGSKWWRRRRWWEAVARPSSWTPSGKGCSRRTPGTQFNREKNLA